MGVRAARKKFSAGSVAAVLPLILALDTGVTSHVSQPALVEAETTVRHGTCADDAQGECVVEASAEVKTFGSVLLQRGQRSSVSKTALMHEEEDEVEVKQAVPSVKKAKHLLQRAWTGGLSFFQVGPGEIAGSKPAGSHRAGSVGEVHSEGQSSSSGSGQGGAHSEFKRTSVDIVETTEEQLVSAGNVATPATASVHETPRAEEGAAVGTRTFAGILCLLLVAGAVTAAHTWWKMIVCLIAPQVKKEEDLLVTDEKIELTSSTPPQQFANLFAKLATLPRAQSAS